MHLPEIFLQTGDTSLHEVAETGKLDVARYLLDHGANTALRNKVGQVVSFKMCYILTWFSSRVEREDGDGCSKRETCQRAGIFI
jgi:hypothetical protein